MEYNNFDTNMMFGQSTTPGKIRCCFSNVSLRNVKHPKLYYTITLPHIRSSPVFKSATITSSTSNPAWAADSFPTTIEVNRLNDPRYMVTIRVQSEGDNALIGSVTVPIHALLLAPERKMFTFLDGKYPDSRIVFNFIYRNNAHPAAPDVSLTLKDLNADGLYLGHKWDYPSGLEIIISSSNFRFREYYPHESINGTHKESMGRCSREDLAGAVVNFKFSVNSGRTDERGYSISKDVEVSYVIKRSDLDLNPTRIPIYLTLGFAEVSTTLIIDGLGDSVDLSGKSGIVPGSVKTAPSRFHDDRAGLGEEYIERYDESGKKYYLNILTGDSKHPFQYN